MTEVNDGETLDVECTVERVYPVGDLEFQLVSGDNAVSNSQSGVSTDTNSDDGAISATRTFSVEFLGSDSLTDAELQCKVNHTRGNEQSAQLSVTVACEYRERKSASCCGACAADFLSDCLTACCPA